MRPSPEAAPETRDAIAWRSDATVGDIALADGRLTGLLSSGLLACRLSAAGKFRNGAARWWCAPHQSYWGVKADLARADGCCKLAHETLNIVLDPLRLDVSSGAPAQLTLSSDGIRVRHAALDVTVPALALSVHGLWDHLGISQINVTPPALAALHHADGCVDCARCGHPHLDLGEFSLRAHRRHTCGHCGHDSTHSGGAIISNPLYRLRERLVLSD